MAALMRLSDKLDRQAAGRLNVNEMQRLAIGRSAIVHPDIFCGRALSNLDAAFRAEMRTELKHLQREIKQTMVYVT
jgi:multiple sugar transport system ATP-binding protein